MPLRNAEAEPCSKTRAFCSWRAEVTSSSAIAPAGDSRWCEESIFCRFECRPVCAAFGLASKTGRLPMLQVMTFVVVVAELKKFESEIFLVWGIPVHANSCLALNLPVLHAFTVSAANHSNLGICLVIVCISASPLIPHTYYLKPSESKSQRCI